ncbi:MAG: TIGR01777 family oxidoreductase [Bryobacteraceae bacterium]|nr:TIGR01777 family oxidoreductase [Bryobacteraceae bacterium]
MNITLTGASGFIGNQLIARLRARGHTPRALGRRTIPGVATSVWDSQKAAAPLEGLEGADAVIHLAGEPVAQRWTDDAKRRIRDSRVAGTRNLLEGIAGLQTRPRVLISASAVGIYGSRGDERITEHSAPGHGFLEDLCVEWESEAGKAAALGMRVVKIRIGIVLGPNGGALEQMLPPFRLGIGGPLGSGKQWMAWIHRDDLVEMMIFALENDRVHGILNGAAPNPVTNREFTRELARVVRRPAIFPVPAIALRALYGEMSGILLASQRVVPEAALACGFTFQFRELGPALRDVVR